MKSPERRRAPRKPSVRVALVTGAGVRVGRAIALHLARSGAAVAVHHHRSERGAAATVRDIEAAGGRARAFRCDLRDPTLAAQLVNDVAAWTGRLDILVCSAAAFDRRPFEQIDGAAWRDMLALNLEAPLRLAQAAAPHLRRRRGIIVNILDVAAFHAWKGYAHYAAAKAGLAMLTRVLALELAPKVRVCGVAPGTVAFAPDTPARDRQKVVSRIPLGRIGRPDDVARAVLHLCDAPYMTGAIVAVDGGRLAGTSGLL